MTFAQGSTGELLLLNSVAFHGEITGFAGNGTGAPTTSDKIDLRDINFNSPNFSKSYVNNILTVSDGTHTANIQIVGTYTLANFHFAADGSGGTLITDPATAGNTLPTIAMGVVGQNDVVNVTQTTAGVVISGTESNADGQTVTITILNSGNQVVDTLTTVASAGTWSTTLSESQLSALPSGIYTFQASVSAATPASQIVTVARSLEWVATSGGDWAQGSNWSTGVAPTAVDSATIDRTGSYSVTISGADTVGSLLVTDPGATVSINANANLAVTGTLTLSAGSLNLSGTLSGGTIVSSGGTIVWSGGTLSGVTYDGTLNLSPNSSTSMSRTA